MIGIITALIFLALSAIHVYWAFGGGRGFEAALPTMDGKLLFTPSRAMTLFVAAGLFAFASIVFGVLGVWGSQIPNWIFKFAVWGIAAIFYLRALGDFRYVGFFKRIKNTLFFIKQDTLFYSPLCVLIAMGCTLVAI